MASRAYYKRIFPNLEREVLVEDVWIRLYVVYPKLSVLDPPPSIVAEGMFEDIDEIRHNTKKYVHHAEITVCLGLTVSVCVCHVSEH